MGRGGLSNIDYSCFCYLITRLPNIYVCMLRTRPSRGVPDFSFACLGRCRLDLETLTLFMIKKSVKIVEIDTMFK